jgi:hypothetical protein
MRKWYWERGHPCPHGLAYGSFCYNKKDSAFVKPKGLLLIHADMDVRAPSEAIIFSIAMHTQLNSIGRYTTKKVTLIRLEI